METVSVNGQLKPKKMTEYEKQVEIKRLAAIIDKYLQFFRIIKG